MKDWVFESRLMTRDWAYHIVRGDEGSPAAVEDVKKALRVADVEPGPPEVTCMYTSPISKYDRHLSSTSHHRRSYLAKLESLKRRRCTGRMTFPLVIIQKGFL